MGLGNSNEGGKKFVTIVGGKWTLRVPEGTPGAVVRVLEKGPNAGKEIHELYYDHIDGELVGGIIKQGQFGTDICIDLKDGETYTVQIPMESQYFSQFAKMVPNIDPTKPLYLGLGYDKERGKNFLYGKQNGETVHSAYTKDNPNGMPPPVEKMVKGVKKWDFEAQENFLYEVVTEFFATVFVGGMEEGSPF
jgi:hypothetical protein